MEKGVLSGTSLAQRLFITLVIVLLFSPTAWAGQWAKTYGGTGDDLAYSIQQTINGGYVAAGSTNSFGTGNYDSWVLKLDVNGGIVWQKTYGGTGDDYVNFIRQNANGGYIMAGKTGSFGAGGYDVWLLRLYSDGAIRWQKSYGGAADEFASSIRQTSDGAYIMAGSTNSFGAGGYDAWLLRLYADGTIRWQKTYGSTGDDYGSSIQQTLDGGYIMAGSTNSPGAQGHDMWVLKLDVNGGIVWQKTYGGAGDDYADSVQQTMKTMGVPDGYIVAGKSYSFGAGGADPWVVKLDLNGNILWQKTYGGNGDDYANSIQQTSDGGYIMSGGTASFVTGGTELSDAFLLKLDTMGTVEWQRAYSEGYKDSVSLMEQTSDSYIAVGNTESLATGVHDFLVLRLHRNGDIAGCQGLKTTNTIVKNTAALVGTTKVKGMDSGVSPITTAADEVKTSSTGQLMCNAELTLYSPKGGEVISAGAVHSVEWGYGIGAVKFDLMYSTDGGTTWMDVADSVTGTNYDWHVPMLTETEDGCLARVIGYDSHDIEVGDVISHSTFTVDVLDIIQPKGGETLKSGTVYTMTWNIGTLNPVARENVYYTDDSGNSWTLITSRLGEFLSYHWEVPWVTNKKINCKIKVELFDPNGLMVGTDTSDGFFTIQPSYVPPVTVISPNGGETLTSGEKYDITWETNSLLAAAKAVLSYSADGGTTWSRITAVHGGPGVYAWTVPALGSEKCKLKVVLKDASETVMGRDTSDDYFTIVQ